MCEGTTGHHPMLKLTAATFLTLACVTTLPPLAMFFVGVGCSALYLDR